jgi:hypothetical protein
MLLFLISLWSPFILRSTADAASLTKEACLDGRAGKDFFLSQIPQWHVSE